MPVSVKANNAQFDSQHYGRTAQLLARQQEIRAQLVQDPLLDLATVRCTLGVSYGTLNKLLSTGALRYWQAVPGAQRRVRQSVLQQFLESGDRRSAGVEP